MREQDLGIYCVENKKFYFLETGTVIISNTVDRLKKALLKRNLIDFSPSSFMDTNRYNVITCREAKLSNYDMEPIFISKHVEEVFKNKTSKEDKATRWT